MNHTKLFDYLVLIASIILITALSLEVLDGDTRTFSRWYLVLQLIICIIFVVDFFVHMRADSRPIRYLWRHLPILIVSLPYLSLSQLLGIYGDSESMLLIALTPTLRLFVAIYIVLRWLVRETTAQRIFYAYILSVTSLTYISSLLFYECEVNLNSAINSFGDALWWASLALTTTELTITPITTTGKILAVIMPLSGMLMLPIATNFLFSMHKRR